MFHQLLTYLEFQWHRKHDKVGSVWDINSCATLIQIHEIFIQPFKYFLHLIDTKSQL